MSTLRILVVGAPGAGTSTLLANLLYQSGRLPFSLVKPRGAPPDYWELFNGQQTQAGAAVTSSPSSSASSSGPGPSSLPAASASFIAAHPKLHELNVRRYNYRNYIHALYTDRYRIELMHANTAHMHSPSQLQPQPQQSAAATPTASGKQRSAPASSAAALPTAQQSNLQVLAALQCDFVLLVVDGSSGAAFAPTAAMQHQLLVAAMVGVRTVVVCVTKMDAGGGGGGGSGSSGSGAWSKKKFEAVLAAVISSFLKPLGFASANILSIPVSGQSGENLLARQSGELAAWYAGPTLLGLLDRVAMPLGRQVESVADRRVVAVVTDAPSVTRNMLNDDVVDAVRVRVQVLSGLVLHAEPLAFVAASVPAREGSGVARSSFLPLGPVHLAALERDVREDPRDLAVYEDDAADDDARGGDPAAAAAAASAAAAAASALAKHKVSADGRKLTNAERKAAIADAKKEHARKAAKEKQAASGKHAAWEDEAAKWVALEAEAEAAEAEAAEAEASAAADAAAAAVAAAESAARISSRSAQPPPPNVSLSSQASPCLTPGDVGTVTLRCMASPASNNDDDLSTLLTGRNMSELVASNSALVLRSLAKQMRPGDMLVFPAEAGGADALRFVTAFKAEVLALPTWPADVHVANGQAVTMVPLRAALPSPASVSYASPASLLALLAPPPARHMPLGSVPIIIDRLVSILNKSNRAVARKKPDYLAGPAPAVAGVPATAASAPDLAIVEFSCRPTVLDTFAAGGNRLGTFLIVHQETVIALATITQIMATC